MVGVSGEGDFPRKILLHFWEIFQKFFPGIWKKKILFLLPIMEIMRS